MKYSVITIGREYGSGGRIIGKKLSEELGIPFYDKKIIELTAKRGGFSEEVVKEAESKKPSSLEYSFYLYNQDLPVSDKVFLAQFKVIQEIAQSDRCIIVGRCGDYILREDQACLKVYIHAPMEEKVKRAMEVYNVKEKNMEAFVRKEDNKRNAYYKYFTHRNRDLLSNYDLVINSSIGIDKVVKVIAELYSF